MHIYLSGQHSARNHTTGKEWPSVVIHIYQQGNVFRVVRIPILELLLPSWPKKKKIYFRLISCEYASIHTKHRRKILYFLLFDDQLLYSLFYFVLGTIIMLGYTEEEYNWKYALVNVGEKNHTIDARSL